MVLGKPRNYFAALRDCSATATLECVPSNRKSPSPFAFRLGTAGLVAAALPLTAAHARDETGLQPRRR